VLSWSPTTTIPVVQTRLCCFAAAAPRNARAALVVGRFVLDSRDHPRDWQCHFDMILVERIQARPPTDSGLYVPSDDLPKLHLCHLLAMGPGEELVGNGTVAQSINQSTPRYAASKRVDQLSCNGRKQARAARYVWRLHQHGRARSTLAPLSVLVFIPESVHTVPLACCHHGDFAG
jgi:hypothetical protein